VVNATGVLLHTNLGRSPLSAAAAEHIADIARGYCNLELDLNSGDRTRRDDHVEMLLLQVLALRSNQSPNAFAAAHRILIVNNCAAAVFLALNSLAEGAEVIVSRGELVEIGGGFRIPEILRKSGAVLREVGTTNRTRVGDYEAAIVPETKLILRVHQSNFTMQGFTERPKLQDLVALGVTRSIPVFEDQGTGCIDTLESYGIVHESSLNESLRAGLDLIAASGDKLLGGPQCGILVGKREIMATLQKNPLLRVFRVDKLTYAALEATLLDYLAGNDDAIPIIRMLRATPEEVEARCRTIAEAVRSDSLHADVISVKSVVGGGTTPGATLQSFALALSHSEMSAMAMAKALRASDPPVVTRVSEERVLLDLRTVERESDALLTRALREVLTPAEPHGC
jgi:L-seryl-tRNA(Ser) seleniumtransferase